MSSDIKFHDTPASCIIKILGEDERDLVTIYADEPRVEVHHPGMEMEAAKIFWNAINTENPVAANDRKYRELVEFVRAIAVYEAAGPERTWMVEAPPDIDLKHIRELVGEE